MAPHKAEASVRRSGPAAALAPVVFEVNPSAESEEEGSEADAAAGAGEAGGEARRSGKKRRRGGKRRRGKRGDLPLAQATGEPAPATGGDEAFDENGEPADGQLVVIRRLHDVPVELPEVNGNVEPSAYVPIAHAGGARHLRDRQPPRGVPSHLAGRNPGPAGDAAARPRRRGGKRRGGRGRRPDGAPLAPGAASPAPPSPAPGSFDTEG